MRSKFVKTENVKAFLAGVAKLEDRGAPEASMMLVSGQAGYGKSRTSSWWAVQAGGNPCFIRLKAAATPHWLLTDLVRELNESAPAFSCEKLFAQAVGSLAAAPRPIIVDEIEAGLRDIKVIETLRDISDVAEVPVVMVGREYVAAALKRYPQIDTRISARVEFAPITVDDVGNIVAELCEVELDGELVERVHRAAEGRIRNVMKALKSIEGVGKRKSKGRLLSADFDDAGLVRATSDRKAA